MRFFSKIGFFFFLLACLAKPEEFPQLDSFKGRPLRVSLQTQSGQTVLYGKLQAQTQDSLEIFGKGDKRIVPLHLVVKIELMPAGRWKKFLLGATVWAATAGVLYEKSEVSREARMSEAAMVGGLVGALWDRAKIPEPTVLFERQEEAVPEENLEDGPKEGDQETGNKP